MAETKLVLTFGVSGGGETTMTLSDAKASMSKETIGAAMSAMVDANCFATSKGAAYTSALGAKYSTTADTVLFDNTDDTADNDYPAAA